MFTRNNRWPPEVPGWLTRDRRPVSSVCRLTRNLEAAMPYVLGLIDTRGRRQVRMTVDMSSDPRVPHPLGFSIIVPVEPGDEVVWARRGTDLGFSKFVKKKSQESDKVTVVLKARDESPDKYLLLRAYVGDTSEREPWDVVGVPPEDRSAMKRAMKFWQHHAYVFDEVPLIVGSSTTQNPW